jgi:deoxyadenosine/deoxycytidine kinase
MAQPSFVSRDGGGGNGGATGSTGAGFDAHADSTVAKAIAATLTTSCPCMSPCYRAGGRHESAVTPLLYFAPLDFRHLAIEGPPALGKTALAERLAARLDAALVLEDGTNPFLADLYSGRAGAAFQAQLFFTLARHRQLLTLQQRDLFSQITIADFLFERDRIYAFMNLDDNELFIYQKVFDLVARDLTRPDVVVYLQTPTDRLITRVRRREIDAEYEEPAPSPADAYLTELNEAYQHFFFHYTATPLLVVETSAIDVSWNDEAVDELLRQLRGMPGGTQYYVPRQ